MLFDSHAHLNNKMSDKDRAAMVAAIEASDLDFVMDIGFDLASSKLAADHAAKYPWCYAAAGFHPHDAENMDDMDLIMIKGLAKKNKVMAIGEIGLDFHYDRSPRDIQREAFRKQIRLANELKMPIVIHSREAD
ncbi:MAG: TatD family hydrolase, partial [Firmicutes bacterium]|nr:TatD family hydrolase [Bacillota bacterium]